MLEGHICCGVYICASRLLFFRYAYNTTKTLEELRQLEKDELNAKDSMMTKVCG